MRRKTKWHRIDITKFNPEISYADNIKNGCDLPPDENTLVVIYYYNKDRYLIGYLQKSIMDNKLVVYYPIGEDELPIVDGVDTVYWKEFDIFDETDEDNHESETT